MPVTEGRVVARIIYVSVTEQSELHETLWITPLHRILSARCHGIWRYNEVMENKA
jgi:hypothetical protein